MLRPNRRKSVPLGALAILLTLVLPLLSAVTHAAEEPAVVDSKEYKVLLQVERFADRNRGVSQFWREVAEVAEQIHLRVKGSMDESKERRVQFLDTKDFALRNSHQFVLRIRTNLKLDGSEKKRNRVTLKYRGDNIEAAAKIDASSTEGKDREEKLEEDIVPPHVSRFSKSGNTEIEKAKNKFKEISDVAEVFPVLGQLSIQNKKVRVVNGFRAHEIKVEGAEISLDGEHEAKASLTFWYDRNPDGGLLVAEFSFNYDVGREAPAALHQSADRFFSAILTEMKEWVEECPKTKTQIAYEYTKPRDSG